MTSYSLKSKRYRVTLNQWEELLVIGMLCLLIRAIRNSIMRKSSAMSARQNVPIAELLSTFIAIAKNITPYPATKTRCSQEELILFEFSRTTAVQFHATPILPR